MTAMLFAMGMLSQNLAGAMSSLAGVPASVIHTRKMQVIELFVLWCKFKLTTFAKATVFLKFID